MNDKMESFRFEWESDIDEWIAQIDSVVTGEPVKRKTEADMIAEAMAIVETIEEPIEKMKGILGIKSDKEVSCRRLHGFDRWESGAVKRKLGKMTTCIFTRFHL